MMITEQETRRKKQHRHEQTASKTNKHKNNHKQTNKQTDTHNTDIHPQMPAAGAQVHPGDDKQTDSRDGLTPHTDATAYAQARDIHRRQTNTIAVQINNGNLFIATNIEIVYVLLYSLIC